MTTALAVTEEVTREKPPEAAATDKGRPFMTQMAEFCRYPTDIEGCCQSLIQSWQGSSLSEHCIFEGLRADRHQCRQVLLNGLYSKGSTGENPGPAAGKADLKEACKQVVLLGYPLKIKAVQELFYTAYYQLVQTVVHRTGTKDDGEPSADDISQQVFADLHEHLVKGGHVKGSLSAYIASTTIHECFRAFKEASRHLTPLPETLEIGTSPYAEPVPPPVAECWEHLDWRLSRSDQGDVINRTIFAQQCLEGWSVGKRPSAKQLMADWQSLAKMSEQDIATLHKRTISELNISDYRSVVRVAAKLVNEGLARPFQMAIVFAAGSQMDLARTARLIGDMLSLSAGAVYTRASRIRSLLRRPGTEQE